MSASVRFCPLLSFPTVASNRPGFRELEVPTSLMVPFGFLPRASRVQRRALDGHMCQTLHTRPADDKRPCLHHDCPGVSTRPFCYKHQRQWIKLDSQIQLSINELSEAECNQKAWMELKLAISRIARAKNTTRSVAPVTVLGRMLATVEMEALQAVANSAYLYKFKLCVLLNTI